MKIVQQIQAGEIPIFVLVVLSICLLLFLIAVWLIIDYLNNRKELIWNAVTQFYKSIPKTIEVILITTFWFAIIGRLIPYQPIQEAAEKVGELYIMVVIVPISFIVLVGFGIFYVMNHVQMFWKEKSIGMFVRILFEVPVYMAFWYGSIRAFDTIREYFT